MENRKRQAKTCPNENCEKTFATINKCRKHTKYHRRNKNVNNQFNQLNEQKQDRRTIQGRGTPDEKENIYQNRITYNPDISKWV